MSDAVTSVGRAIGPKTRARLKAPWQVWRDAGGKISALRVVALAFLFVPVVIAVYDFNTEGFGARPLNNVIHRTGYWALIFLMTSLAVTPLRRVARLNQLVDVRRMIGVGAFVYAACHISLYVADQMFDFWKVASEIALRLYLTIGFVALIGLAALAATSTDGMVRRLGGRRWQFLHNAIYGIGLLALIHFFQQTKADVSVPTFVAGLFGWMIGYRLIVKLRKTRAEPPTWMLLALSIAIAALTFIAEAIGIGLVFNVSPLRVLQTAFDFSDIATIRPGWLVLAAGLIVTAVDLVRAYLVGPRRSFGGATAKPIR
ncbi:MAG: sulfoxide reductase heme-binding subunit YedZ [Rhizobiales bacterium]|jgi:sulfoxide reductase heme-binding subunit YedZ|nr:sulfoxide reductase heme-binding subunit YedZ [Hyphomicrobiales bacterium]